MAIKQQSYQITGMRQDNLVGTGTSNKYAHEIMNLRMNTVGDYTTAAWSTEEGTLKKPVEWVDMPSDALELLVNNDTVNHPIIPIGQAIINDVWVVFATQTLTDENDPMYNGRVGHDFIFKYWYREGTEQLLGTILYAGDLNFDAKHPCETLEFYENDKIQKVYWTDGKNQPRVINIVGVKYHTNLDKQFDFVQEVSLRERVDITKKTDGAGLFPPCTVKYCITYYKKYGQETNIVYDSPLYYPIKGNRACSPDELSGDSFEIKVTNIDVSHGFDYIRLYSIIRTSENATPIVRIVCDKEIASLPELTPYDPTRVDSDPDSGYNPNISNKYALFIDTNTTGEIVDPTVLQYIGGKELIAQTFAQKSNTMFLGNITLKSKSAYEALDGEPLESSVMGFTNGDYNTIKKVYESGGYSNQHVNADYFALDHEKAIGIRVNKEGEDHSFYQYSNQLTATKHWHSYEPDFGLFRYREHNGNSQRIKIFKYGEVYRFGIQFQNINGNWSEVMYLCDRKNDQKPITDVWSSVGVFGIFRYQLPNSAVKKLLSNNYVKARLVCCYPNNTDRTVLAQGVISPTVANYKWKNENCPDAMSSWFYRFGPLVNSVDISKDEIQSIQDRVPVNYRITNGNGKLDLWSGEYKTDSKFFTLPLLVTYSSPEIELDESIRTLDLTAVGINRVGLVPQNSGSNRVHAEYTNQAVDYAGFKGEGLKNAASITSFSGNSVDVTYNAKWNDLDVYASNYYDRYGPDEHPQYGSSQLLAITYDYRIHPFQRAHLGNYMKDFTIDISIDRESDNQTIIKDSSKLQSKVWSTLRVSMSSLYNDALPLDIHDFQIFDSNEVIPIKIFNGSSSLIYNGNMNTIAPIASSYTVKTSIQEYQGLFHTADEWHPRTCPDTAEDGDTQDERRTMNDSLGLMLGSYELDAGKRRTGGDIGLDLGVSSDPVPITYTSIAHGVISLSEGVTDIPANNLLLVDVRRNVTNRFGGKPSPSNIYLPCGPVVDLRECEDDVQDIHNSPILIGLEGDHYYQRYDCLKTYPRSIEDVNQVVEILSFMCETRINLDGRYDRNRGLADNTTITNKNFNLINKSYTQSNNFFTYTSLDEDASTLDKFANQFTWTKSKVSGEDIDTWTNITLISTADTEGICGGITKLVNVGDKLYVFQDHGISMIGYNEKTALSTEAGIPLEIANSGKYSGLQYLTKDIGCQNKWSVSISKNGVFFIDDSRQELLTIGENIKSLSTANGFDAFMIQQIPDSEHFTPWTPYNPKNFVSYYDKLGNDVLYINKDYCLAWNEQSGTFTSFYSYNNVPIMANIGTHLLMWDINTPMVFDISSQEHQEAETVWEYVETTTSSSSIYDDDSHLILTFNHYIANSSYNVGISDNVTNPIHIERMPDHICKPAIIWKSNNLDNLKRSWVRWVVQPRTYNDNNYNWHNHWILSLEFRKDGQPYIIQYEVEGTHKKVNNYNKWVDDPLPDVKLRVTNNVPQECIDMLKGFFLGGFSQPTFNFGNIMFDGGTGTGNYKSAGAQPWDTVDSSFVTEIDGTEREVICIAKLYDLLGTVENDIYTAPDPIIQWLPQGVPFRSSDQWDQAAQVTSDQYTDDILSTEIAWEPRTVIKTTNIYVVNNDGCDTGIWAARELVEDGQSVCGKFFGHWQPYWLTLVCDGITSDGNAFPSDKVFNNVEYRADVFDRITGLPRADINLPVFDKKAAYNGYQAYKEFPIEAVRKFNIWRLQLPRATYYKDGQFVTTRDRIRNPFCYIKLLNTNDNPLPNRMVLHDLVVYFDMR